MVYIVFTYSFFHDNPPISPLIYHTHIKDNYTHQNITFWLEDEETRSKKPKSDWLFLNTYEDFGVVPKGHVWVIGDNRRMSWMGKVKIKDIEGLVLF